MSKPPSPRRDECERVKRCGARVLTLDQLEGLKDPNVEHWGTEEDNDGDPPRLWAPNATYPGTAFTRSIGDSGEYPGTALTRSIGDIGESRQMQGSVLGVGRPKRPYVCTLYVRSN